MAARAQVVSASEGILGVGFQPPAPLTRSPPDPAKKKLHSLHPNPPAFPQEQHGDVPPDLASAQRALHHVPRAHGQGLGGGAQGPDHGAVRDRDLWVGRAAFTSSRALSRTLTHTTPTNTNNSNSFFFVTEGEITITPAEEDDDDDEGSGDNNKRPTQNDNTKPPPPIKVGADGWAYFPPGWDGDITSTKGATLVAFERIFAKADADPVFLHGRTADSPLLPTAPEVFRLRKLLPQTGDYDFNVHVMDFSPGEFLEVKEVHYNQHGMIILQGQGVYRLGERWIPVQAGDVIWMAPYVPQWYAALGKTNTRYLLYKDVGVDPLVSP